MAGIEAAIYPLGFRDGESLRIEICGAMEFAGQAVTAMIYGLDDQQVEWTASVPVVLDAAGFGEGELVHGLSLGT